MYCLIGDYVRIGNSQTDPKHSVLVSELTLDSQTFISMNRIGRKLHMHVWKFKSKEKDGCTGEIEPIYSEEFVLLRDRFNKIEADNKKEW